MNDRDPDIEAVEDPAQLRAMVRQAREHAARNDAAVAELRHAQELSRRLVEAMPGGVVHVAADGAIVRANREALRVLGLKLDELTNKYTVDFQTETLFEDGRPCPVEEYPVSRALTSGCAQPPETIGVRRPDGTISWAVFTAVPIHDDDGATTGAVVTFIDITRRKQLERNLREAQKMEGIGRLAGGVAHDFNNLLTTIGGNAHELHSALDPDDARREDVSHVLAACERASALTHQMLSFARRQTIAPELLELGELVQQTASLMCRTIGEHIELSLELADSPAVVDIDRTQFERVLINLALNAKDAMPHGGALTLTVAHGPDQQVRLRVRDSGTGMSAQTLEHVFEPFFTTKEAGQGTGLGLATCYGIVAQAGGRIDIKSELGKGTTVEVTLPRAEGVVAQPAPASTPEPVLAGDETVLLVEDEPAVRRVVQRALERYGYRVLAADSGDAALPLLASSGEAVSLLLTDVVMPKMSGVELAGRVRAEHPRIEVIYMSGYADDALDPHGVDRHATVLRKPFDPATLARRVREQLDRRRQAL